MAAIGNTISSDLATQIQLLSTIQDDTNLDPADKQAKLRQEGEKTLAMIAKEKGSLSIVNSAFAGIIQDSIQVALASDDWDGIPPPAEMKQGIADLQQVSQALSIALSNGFNDTNDILKLLIDINSKIQLSNALEWLTHLKNNMEAANAQFAKMKEHIDTQHTADRKTAIGQIAGGAISCAMNTVSLTGSILNAKKQLGALKTQKTMHGLEDNLEMMAAKSKQASKDVGKQKAELERMKATNQTSAAEMEAQDIKIASHEAIHIDAQNKYATAKTSYREAKHNAEKISIKGQRDTAIWNGVGASGTAWNAMSTGAANLEAADDRRDAGMQRLDADKYEYQKSFEQSLGQTAYERFQSAGRTMEKIIQAKINMEQSNAGLMSTINNKV
jgi:hypothetical protein